MAREKIRRDYKPGDKVRVLYDNADSAVVYVGQILMVIENIENEFDVVCISLERYKDPDDLITFGKGTNWGFSFKNIELDYYKWLSGPRRI